jgi:ribosomal protein S18 acetylase RimI-like enzyme
LDYTIRKMSKQDLEEVVRIHIKAFPGFFLTILGRDFLFNLYDSFLNDDLSICLVAVKNSFIKGFMVGNLKPDNLFRRMLFKKGYLFFFNSVSALLKSPVMVSRKLLSALRYRGDRPVKYKNGALLSSVGVDPDEELKGIGSNLVKVFCHEAFKRGSDVVYLTTDKFGNENVNLFYKKNGFRLESIIEKAGGRNMNIYVKFPDEENL